MSNFGDTMTASIKRRLKAEGRPVEQEDEEEDENSPPPDEGNNSK
jgi:hypothetical protein